MTSFKNTLLATAAMAALTAFGSAHATEFRSADTHNADDYPPSRPSSS